MPRLPTTIAGLQAEYREGRLSPVDVVGDALRRCERLNPTLNFVAHELAQRARLEAEWAAADLEKGDHQPGALLGVPITVKDNLPTLGDPLTQGSRTQIGTIGAVEPAGIKRLRDAGAIVVAKTTTPEFAHSVTTTSDLFGVTRNPWSVERTPGGSSGGASAAVAGGVGVVAIGTDGGGSIRCPASCCGLYGLKATLGRIPFETMPDGFANYAFMGPLARTVGDLASVLAVMAGEHRDDPHALSVAAPPIESIAGKGTPSLGGRRAAWIGRIDRYSVDWQVSEAMAATLRHLSEAGVDLVELSDRSVLDVFDDYVVIATSAHAGRYGALLDSQPDLLTPSMRACIEQGRTWSAARLVQALDARTRLFRSIQAILKDVDFLLTPTLTAPPKLATDEGAINSPAYAEWACFLYPFNLTGHPAVTMPMGLSDAGLPIGLQAVGNWYAENDLIDLMRWMEAATAFALPDF